MLVSFLSDISLDRLTQDAIFFFATIDPIGTLALFVALTAKLTPAKRRKTAHRAVIFSLIILIGFILVGQVILSAANIRLLSLQVAGGIILFLLGLQMLFLGSDLTSSGNEEKGHDLAIFPLAIPSIAGPGAIMAVIVRTDNNLYSFSQQVATAFALLVIMAVLWIMLLLSGRILGIIGHNGATILVRILGMLLAALSIELVFTALGIPGWLI